MQQAEQRAIQVLVDEPAIDREFTYLLPPELASGRVPVGVGTIVRVVLNRRRLRGWVTGLDAPVPRGVGLALISSVVGVGPPPHVVELAGWAAWRWAGTRVHFLRIASPDRVVAGVPSEPSRWPDVARAGDPRPTSSGPPGDSDAAPAAGASGLSSLSGDSGASAPPGWERAAWATDRQFPRAVRLSPCADKWPLVVEALRHGRTLVLVPTVAWAAELAGRLRRAGVSTALAPRDWAGAAAAHAVVGARSAAWAPCGRLDAVLVLDEHDEAYQSEAAPTWNARDVAVERARRDGAHCLLVGPMPSPDALALCERRIEDPAAARATAGAAAVTVIASPRRVERDGWPQLQVADRRQDDPATGEWCGETLAELLRSDDTVVCVLNRTGRARLAYCNSCGELACSAQTGRPLRLDKQLLTDLDTGEVRPAVCESCGAMKFRRARVGVKGVAEEMERLALRPVIQVVGDAVADAPGVHGRKPPLYIGTEAVLHRVRAADAVAFLDFDQELMAPRYRAAEEAFALLVRAARLVGPRSGHGRILVQTRLPAHPVLGAAVEADPDKWLRDERDRRAQMRQPPASTWALVSGAAAPAFIERLSVGPHAHALDIDGPADGTWRIRSDEHASLLDALAGTERPSGRLRVAVDPMRA